MIQPSLPVIDIYDIDSGLIHFKSESSRPIRHFSKKKDRLVRGKILSLEKDGENQKFDTNYMIYHLENFGFDVKRVEDIKSLRWYMQSDEFDFIAVDTRDRSPESLMDLTYFVDQTCRTKRIISYGGAPIMIEEPCKNISIKHWQDTLQTNDIIDNILADVFLYHQKEIMRKKLDIKRNNKKGYIEKRRDVDQAAKKHTGGTHGEV